MNINIANNWFYQDCHVKKMFACDLFFLLKINIWVRTLEDIDIWISFVSNNFKCKERY